VGWDSLTIVERLAISQHGFFGILHSQRTVSEVIG
jgi:hypothetical protein